MKKKKISLIAIKFSGIVCAIILIIMPIMASLIMQQTRNMLIKEMEIRAEFFARDIRESLFPKPDTFQLYFSAKEMVKEKAVIYAMVIDERGNIISHNDKEMIAKKVEKGIVTAKVKVKIEKPIEVTAIISKEAVEELDIKTGDEVKAVIKATEVMISKESQN